jgi:glycerol-3-phosphate dehydrogenase (NAD(P)+)
MARIGIIGGGAWGTALSLVAVRAGARPVLWAREAEVVESVNRDHENPHFLPGVALDPQLRATGSLADAAVCDLLLLVVPAQFLRATLTALAPDYRTGTPVVVCAKGIERKTCALMSEIVADILPNAPLAVLSGPTFAGEVARGLPTAVTLACADLTLAERIARQLGTKTFRTYLSDDIIGAQIGGAVKNVLAIACGITMGRKLGENARAALITRGLAEMIRLGLAKGARMSTMMGLSGFGDLSLTCNSAQSRNTSLGIKLGQGASRETAMDLGKAVAEGAFTADAVRELANRLDVDMPICFAVDEILNQRADIGTVIEQLLERPVKEELAGAPAR